MSRFRSKKSFETERVFFEFLRKIIRSRFSFKSPQKEERGRISTSNQLFSNQLGESQMKKLIVATLLLMSSAASADILGVKLSEFRNITLEIEHFHYNPNSNQIDAQARVCPPIFFGWLTGGSKLLPKLRTELEHRVNRFRLAHSDDQTIAQVKRSYFNTQFETGWFRSASDGSRCTVATAVYDVTYKSRDAVKRECEIKVGVRDGFPMISQKEDGAWNGAAIVFANNIAIESGCQIRFVTLENGGSRISALEYGLADIVISLFTITPSRAERVSFSDPYFSTGLRAATMDGDIYQSVDDIDALNDPSLTIVTTRGSTPQSYAETQLSKANLRLLDNWDEVYNAASGSKGTVVISDETILFSWRDFFMLREGNGGVLPLTGGEEYGVGVKKGDPKNLLPAINSAIKRWEVNEMYTSLVGR